MFTTDPTNPTAALRAYAAHKADVYQAFRALVGDRNWLTPVAQLPTLARRSTPAKSLSFGDVAEFPPGELWLFTDSDAAERAAAAGCRLGEYATGIPGVDLFADPPADLTAIRINPVSPPELTWNFPADSFAALRAWAEVIAFEALLADAARGRPLDSAALADFAQFQVFVFPNRTVLTMPEQGGLQNPAVACTAPDCAKAILVKVPEPMRSELQLVVTTGRELADKLPEQGMDGLMVDPAGPGPRLPLRLPPR